MPTETGTAFLVDPMGCDPQKLDKDEFEILHSLLTVIRDEKEVPSYEAVDWILSQSKNVPGSTAKGVLKKLIWHYLNDFDSHTSDGYGVLAHILGDGVAVLDEHEIQTLQHTLSVIRAGGWMSEWLALQVGNIVAASRPEEKFPSPLMIAASLVDCIKEHETQIESALEVARMRPDLFCSQAPEASPEPIAEAEVTHYVAKEPAKAHGARKPRKNASAA